MKHRAYVLPAAALIAGLAAAPLAHADWHGHRRGHWHHGGGNAAGAAIAGGLIGLGLGAAIASGRYYAPYYYAPPPVYYGAPNRYYAPAPPAVYYGYYGY